ncbi:DNA-binding transcriptional LysR family regulator [Herbihabitans rhizosphaerae]|uniref:DNA-binding transcriptional LysR family regulator n=1 Tax=Herbihabitans rhizosphaerae TaxID=1872711 RepID=A0A4Q7KBQ2_9PSEU|nr:LysR substrate-binding domain-containing protein [Herbihabitans rhizosphaerae]RZS30387.1 DNA-binding transcriptional LysR family regulator [Herbihabitans rhizosphaerae]
MELRHLRAAVAVADHLHFGRAAAALGIAQPPLSQAVKALEGELGVPLFERDTRHVRLTAAGVVFVDDARTALSMVESARTRARSAGRGDIGELVVGMVGSAALHPLPRVVRAYRARYPDVTVRFAELPTAGQLERLRGRTLDVGFVRPPLPAPADAEFDLVPVSREPLVVALPKDHRLATRDRVHARALAGEPFVLFPRHLGAGLYDRITAVCQEAGFEPSVVQGAVQMQTIVGLVAAGCGVSIVPGSVAALAGLGTVFVKLSPATTLVELALAVPKDGLSTVAANFVAMARDVTRAAGARPTPGAPG